MGLVFKKGQGRSELERALRARRSKPRPEFYRALMRKATGPGEARRPVLRTAMAAGLAALAVLVFATVAVGVPPFLTNNSPVEIQYKCNSGRGNLSETESGTRQTDSATLINPHEGGQGPGDSPTDDCDPGNSGAVNSGGD